MARRARRREEAMAATVLLVEDERKLRELVRSYLERGGFAVLSAGTGAEAPAETISIRRLLRILSVPFDGPAQLNRSNPAARCYRVAQCATWWLDWHHDVTAGDHAARSTQPPRSSTTAGTQTAPAPRSRTARRSSPSSRRRSRGCSTPASVARRACAARWSAAARARRRCSSARARPVFQSPRPMG